MMKKIEEAVTEKAADIWNQENSILKITNPGDLAHKKEELINKIIAKDKILASPLRRFVHNAIDIAFFLPIWEKFRDKLHYGAIHIFNVAERNSAIPATMLGATLLAVLGRNIIQNIFSAVGTVVTELFSIIGAIVTVTGEALGSTYGIPLVAIGGMLGGYALSAKITNGTIVDPVLENKIKNSLEKELTPADMAISQIVSNLDPKTTPSEKQKSFVEAIKAHRTELNQIIQGR